LDDKRLGRKLSALAVVSLVLAFLWYLGWGAALVFGILGLRDPQGWNWLPYFVWGMWGLPLVVLALGLGFWAALRIRSRPDRLTGSSVALTAVVLSALAAPAWYVAPMIVNLWR